ncbi:Uncharacterised protein [Vibrio cholerae]|nr:Uncharacterised protein [Vibrio cholerae]
MEPKAANQTSRWNRQKRHLGQKAKYPVEYETLHV